MPFVLLTLFHVVILIKLSSIILVPSFPAVLLKFLLDTSNMLRRVRFSSYNPSHEVPLMPLLKGLSLRRYIKLYYFQ